MEACVEISKHLSHCHKCVYVDNTVCELLGSNHGVAFRDIWRLVVGLSTQGEEEQDEEPIQEPENPIRPVGVSRALVTLAIKTNFKNHKFSVLSPRCLIQVKKRKASAESGVESSGRRQWDAPAFIQCLHNLNATEAEVCKWDVFTLVSTALLLNDVRGILVHKYQRAEHV